MLTIKELQPEYVTDENGKTTSVILSLENFMKLVEDIEDLAVVAERREESTTSHKDFLAELQKDGII